MDKYYQICAYGDIGGYDVPLYKGSKIYRSKMGASKDLHVFLTTEFGEFMSMWNDDFVESIIKTPSYAILQKHLEDDPSRLCDTLCSYEGKYRVYEIVEVAIRLGIVDGMMIID